MSGHNEGNPERYAWVESTKTGSASERLNDCKCPSLNNMENINRMG